MDANKREESLDIVYTVGWVSASVTQRFHRMRGDCWVTLALTQPTFPVFKLAFICVDVQGCTNAVSA